MPEDQKSSFSEAVETGASAAHTIRGAIKTGKAISSAAKGAAAGGPYGAVAGAVWAGRKHIGKIIVAVIALLMLPVLFVLMLPGLIFGGLTNAFSPSDPEIPILNSETAIIENANEITFTLNGILGEALDDVLARIEADFAASGADHMEVKNAYSGGPIYNANLFISQYCAAKDKDFESISLNDLAATLRENKQHLYSYTSKQEIRESTVTDPETGEETTVSETWMVYTVRYNGESYFSDVVFQLMQQLLCFHPGKEEIIKTLLSHLQKQGRIFQTDTGGYFPSGWAAKSDNSLIRAAWVLLDFIGQVEYHAPGDFPVKLIFFANGELYEIVYAASGQEALINHALRDDRSGGRRIILIDNPEDIRRIDCPGISGFCTVDAAGQVHYFKKTGGT